MRENCSRLVSIDEVALHETWLLLRWVTGCWQINHIGTTQPSTSTQPSIPPE